MTRIERPRLAPPPREAHKYSRGMVAVVAGAMPGAAMLAARAAMHGGAGYVLLAGRDPPGGRPDALVRRRLDDLAGLLADERIGALVLGPGLGDEPEWLEAALASDRALVLDGDALTIAIRPRAAPTILTPHGGEFARMFGQGEGEKLARTQAASDRLGAVVIHKGAETIVAAPDGRIAVNEDAPSWLSTAGAGDVLAGLVGARLASGRAPFEAGCEAAWLHARVAELAGPAFIADDLIPLIPRAIAECL